MNFLVAPNAFKETISGKEATEIIFRELRKGFPSGSIQEQAIADGGDGTCTLLIDSLKLDRVPCDTLDPLGRPVSGFFGFDSYHKRALLDVSTASGLSMLDSYEKNASNTSTFGTGLIIKKAIEFGAEEIILGLGGSATVDLGIGILGALGFTFLDSKGRELGPYTPGLIFKIKHIQRPLYLPNIKFSLLCDVKNYLLGEEGAVRVFGPQKGLSESDLPNFENELSRCLELLASKSKLTFTDREGFGAAGGIAAGLSLFFPLEIKYGARYFFELVNMEEKVRACDWILTGEGKYDKQSTQGKGCYELLQLVKSEGKKIAIITSGNEASDEGFDLVIQLPDLDFSKTDFKEVAKENLGLAVAKAKPYFKTL